MGGACRWHRNRSRTPRIPGRAHRHPGMGGAIGTQISAAVVFNVVMLAVCEMTLVSYLAAPTRTLAIIDHLNSWVRTHRRRILSLMVGVAGVCLVVTGSG